MSTVHRKKRPLTNPELTMPSDGQRESIPELKRRLRDALWGTEAFAIGMLQAVSGALVLGISA